MKRLKIPILTACLILLAGQMLFAQTNPNDTMAVIDGYGRPGDTVHIQLYMANHTVAVGGYTARLVFDQTILQPIGATCTQRGCNLEATSGSSPQDSVMVVVAYSMASNFIPRGTGPVVTANFRVNPGASFGSSTPLRFVDNSPNAINAWSDTMPQPNLLYPIFRNGTFSVTGGGVNQPPRIIDVGPQQVREGQILQFPVTAYDLDGDPVVLSATNLPPNSTFPSTQGDSVVTGTFTFSPDFTQGPDTYYVSFNAQDDHNNTASMPVQIVVLEQPNDMLSVDLNQGGVLGASGRALSVKLYNSHPVYGLQFNYQYDATQLQVTQVIPTARCAGMGFWSNSPDPGKIIILIFSPGLDTIASGSEAIIDFVTDVSELAHFGRSPIVLDSAIEVIDDIGTSRNLDIESGYFTIDRFGDANLDTLVNVGDCVKIVSFIIERSDLNPRQFDAADINRDTRVNVADLQCVIDTILQIVTPAVNMPDWPIASVELLKNQVPSGDMIYVPMWADIGVEASAVQYEITYNPNNLEAIDPEIGEMIDGMQFQNKITAGKINGVAYNLSRQTFGPGAGEMARFGFRIKGGSFDPVHDISLREFLIVNQGAAFIPIDIKGRIPDKYVLSQNYPNPFNSNTNIKFDLPNDGNVEISIYDLLGRKVTTLLNDYLSAGTHTVTWDGRSQTGETMATGIFFYRLRSADFDETKKMTLVK